jgi:phytoene dehydrogenase-like protein
VQEGLAAAARACGVDIRCQTEITQIRHERDRVVGVTLSSGQQVAADIVVANRWGVCFFGPFKGWAGGVMPLLMT